jgi:uncharacterized membrane protein
MYHILVVATFTAALGAGLIAGTFFAFSVFVMGALGKLPAANGIAAMQSINVGVINPVFLGVFMGTAVLSLALLVAALFGWPSVRAMYLVAGGGLYVGGCALVTMLFNVPLNNALAAVNPDSVEGAALWRDYLSQWTTWNTVRTLASLAATAAFILALR